MWQPNAKNRGSLGESDRRAHISPKNVASFGDSRDNQQKYGSLGDSSTENRESLEPYICITSIMGVPPHPPPPGEYLAKSRYFQSRWKFGLKSRVWPLLTCEGWNFAKSRNFDSCQKLNSKLTFLKTQDMRRIKFGKIQKFSNASNIWPKIETFDHSGPVKEKIWQHPEILSCFENLV